MSLVQIEEQAEDGTGGAWTRCSEHRNCHQPAAIQTSLLITSPYSSEDGIEDHFNLIV